jgi:hypothetical protein
MLNERSWKYAHATEQILQPVHPSPAYTIFAIRPPTDVSTLRWGVVGKRFLEMEMATQNTKLFMRIS